MRINGRDYRLRSTFKALHLAEEFYYSDNRPGSGANAIVEAAGRVETRAIAALLYGMLKADHMHDLTEETFYGLTDADGINPFAIINEVSDAVRRSYDAPGKKKTFLRRLLRRK